MQRALVIDNNGDTDRVTALLERLGYVVQLAPSGAQGLKRLNTVTFDIVLISDRLTDIPTDVLLESVLRVRRQLPTVLLSDAPRAKHVVHAMRMGVSDVLEKPISEEDLLESIATIISIGNSSIGATPRSADTLHAALRWANAIMPVVEAPRDSPTIAAWSRVAFASSGALRNWCHTAGISPRRSLVFARLLRAVLLQREGLHDLTNVLDVVDMRTITGLLRFAGFESPDALPATVSDYITRQTLVGDSAAIIALTDILRVRHSAHVPTSHGLSSF